MPAPRSRKKTWIRLRADSFPWHEWLNRPLSEVRRDLGVKEPVSYHPVRSTEVDISLTAA